KDLRQHGAAGQVEELAFKGVEDPAERGDEQNQPLIAGDAGIPFGGGSHEQRGAEGWAGAMARRVDRTRDNEDQTAFFRRNEPFVLAEAAPAAIGRAA